MNTTEEYLDVTVIEPKLKHPTIFKMFDALIPGESFVIHNDHDPKPLYYQLLAERGEIFGWEYLEQGPEFWKVRISLLKDGEQNATIGELVAEDYRKAEVFKKFGLDFCCGGKKSVKDACLEKGIDVLKVEEALKGLDLAANGRKEDYNSWDLDFLADYIMNKHHKYVKESVPLLMEFTQKVARVHGERHPELVKIAEHFMNVANELEFHMHKEEMILFPYIKQLAEAKRSGAPVGPPQFGSIENPIRMMEMEHDQAGDEMKAIRTLSNDFCPPADACNTYNVSFAKLKEFEEDLHQHIHLENNILFPKSIELEKELIG